MQVIVERATQISKFSYEDSEVISATHTNIIVGDPIETDDKTVEEL